MSTSQPGQKPFKTNPDSRRDLRHCMSSSRCSVAGLPKLSSVHLERAEITWGNHTDYNNGYALSCCISRSVIAAFAKRTDNQIRVRSTNYPDAELLFSLDQIKKDEDPEQKWANYVRAVASQFIADGIHIEGADVLVDSNVPSSGGVSSSAAFELAIAAGLCGLFDISLSPMKIALLCKSAENGPLVGTPCGLLDQATVALGKHGHMLLLDFEPRGGDPVTATLIPTNLSNEGYSFIISVDSTVKRDLGSTGYPERRKTCEESLPVLSGLLGKEVSSLRHVSRSEFEQVRTTLLESGGETMVKRVEHIVYENERVLDGVAALQSHDIGRFGEILTASGRSALELYELDAQTPELTFLVKAQRRSQYVVGTRNMGGGFSALSLSLIKSGDSEAFKEELRAEYAMQYNRPLEFIEFQASDGTSRVV